MIFTAPSPWSSLTRRWRGRGWPLSVEALEARALLASLDVAGGVATYLADASSQLTITPQGTTLLLSSGAGTTSVGGSISALDLATQGTPLDLVIDASADTTPAQLTLTANSLGAPTADLFQTLGVPNPVPPVLPIPVQFADGVLHSLTVRGGGGGNVFAIAGTGPYATEIDSGTGQDATAVLATGGPLTIDGQDGHDAVTLGQPANVLDPAQFPGNSLANLHGAVAVRNTAGRTDLVLDNSAAGAPITFDLANDRVATSVSAPVHFDSLALASLTLQSGGSGNTYQIDDTPAGITTTIQAGSADQVHVTQATGALRIADPDGSVQVAAPATAPVTHVLPRGPLPLAGALAGNLAPGAVDDYLVQVTEPGMLTVQGNGTLDTRLTLAAAPSYLNYSGLLVAGGGLILASDDASPALSLHLEPGLYDLAVSATAGSGAYALQTSFVPGPNPFAGPDVDPALNREVGDNPVGLVAADFNRDGILDLATVNQGSGDVSVLLGVGDASFESERRYPVGGHPDALVALDFNQDGRLDLATLDRSAGVVTILPGVGDGTFAVSSVLHLSATDPAVANLFPSEPVTTVLGDFNRDGNPDTASLVSANGDGTPPFLSTVATAVGLPSPLKGDIESPLGPVPISTLITTRLFLPAVSITSSPAHATPLYADLDGSGVPGLVTVTRGGDIWYRPGIPGQPGLFDAAVHVNGGDAPPARAVTVVAGGELAAVDLFHDSISLYRHQPDGSWTRSPGPATGLTPVRIAAGDLNGDGYPDLVVANNSFGLASLSIYRGDAAGNFTLSQELKVDTSISDLQLADVNGDGRLDIVVTDPDAGDVSVLVNQALPGGVLAFQDELRLRAGTGIYGVKLSQGTLLADALFAGLGAPLTFPPLYFLTSNEETEGVAVGDFTGDGRADLVMANRGDNTLTLLTGKPGGFMDPQVVAMANRPLTVVAGDLEHNGKLDLVVLNGGDNTVAVYRGDGQGHFTQIFSTDAGSDPTGLSIADVNGDGRPDLVIGNQFGDALTLLGNGDGTFQPFRRAERDVALAVADLFHTGQSDFIYANQSLDRISIQQGGAAPAVFQDRSDGVLAPGAVQLADLNGDGLPDLVVANGGANEVRVYLGQANGQFGPAQRYFTGTDPVSITIGDVNGDGIPDLAVTNKGSNDVTILLGQGSGAAWSLAPGPRLNSGGLGPVATVLQDVTGSGIPDLLISNSESNTVVQLHGVGNGFFDDTHPVTYAVGEEPGPLFVGNFGKGGLDLVTVNARSSDITLIANFTTAPQTFRFPTGGASPTAAAVTDFNQDGTEDLVVANQSSGLVSLLLGGPTGLTIAGLVALDQPSDVVVTGAGQVFATQEGREAAQQIFFQLGLPTTPGASAASSGEELSLTPPTAPAASPVHIILATGIPVIAPGFEETPGLAESAALTTLTALDVGSLRLVAVVNVGTRFPLPSTRADVAEAATDAAAESLGILLAGVVADRGLAAEDEPVFPVANLSTMRVVIGLDEMESAVRQTFRQQRPYSPEVIPAAVVSWARDVWEALVSSAPQEIRTAPIEPVSAAREEPQAPNVEVDAEVPPPSPLPTTPSGPEETVSAAPRKRLQMRQLALSAFLVAAAWQGWALRRTTSEQPRLRRSPRN